MIRDTTTNTPCRHTSRTGLSPSQDRRANQRLEQWGDCPGQIELPTGPEIGADEREDDTTCPTQLHLPI